MRTSVAIVTLLVVTFLYAADPGLCPDGCRDDVPQGISAGQSNGDAPSECLICQHGVSVVVALELFGDAMSQDRSPEGDCLLPFTGGHPYDHPPRNG